MDVLCSELMGELSGHAQGHRARQRGQPALSKDLGAFAGLLFDLSDGVRQTVELMAMSSGS